MISVAKFGGSSLASSEQFRKVKNIISLDSKRQVIVASAIGKRKNDDNKMTDLLYLLHAHIKYGVDYHHIYDLIKQRFIKIKEDLALKLDLDKEFTKIEEKFSKDMSEEYLVSRGEYLTSMLLAEYLGYNFIDASKVIFFDYDGKINYSKTLNEITKQYQEKQKMVIPGFYGVYPNGDVHLLSRGGSDITGSIVASCLNAKVYENWTDVSGILMADPKYIDQPKRIKEITYDELRELSYMGASVMHEDTIFPVRDLNIPINILNTNLPLEEGTIITNSCNDKSQIITGIAGKCGFESFSILKHREASKIEVISKVLEVFNHYKLNIEHIPTSIDSFSVIVDSKSLDKCFYDVLSDIKAIDDVLEVTIDKNIALIAVVGRNMVLKPGISGKIFAIFGKEDINIKMIAQGSKELSIIVGVSENDLIKAIKAIYKDMVI